MDSRIIGKYLFIGGTGRSGTNITRKIFASNPLVASFPFEYRFIIDPDGVVDFYQSMLNSWSPYMADIKIKRLDHFLRNLGAKSLKKEKYIDWELAKWFPNYYENINALIGELKTFEYNGYWPGTCISLSTPQIFFSEYWSANKLGEILGRFVTNNIDEYMELNDKLFFVEDNTWNILFARELYELVPDSKLLHVVRDPRDVIASFMRQTWCPSDFNQALLMYKSIMIKWLEVEDSLPSHYYKVIKLEDLVDNPKEIVNEICSFSGLPFHDDMLKVTLDRSNTNRWKKELTNDNLNVIETELQYFFQKFEYKL